MLDDLTVAASPSPELDTREMPTFTASTETEAEWLVGRVIDHFGADRNRTVVRVLLNDNRIRYLKRSDLDVFLGAGDKAFGGSAYAGVPGYPLPGSAPEYEFRCPRDGCPYSPLFLLTFTEPPTCRLHGTVLQLAP